MIKKKIDPNNSAHHDLQQGEHSKTQSHGQQFFQESSFGQTRNNFQNHLHQQLVPRFPSSQFQGTRFPTSNQYDSEGSDEEQLLFD